MNSIKQCKSCPWRVGCDPRRDIPRYSESLHCDLKRTIREGVESIFGAQHVMACHYSEPGKETPCAGWLANQIGAGNNIGARLAVMTGRMPPPEVDGPQHKTFADTLPKKKRRAANRDGGGT